jgi:serine/threonine protein kinase/tetratricopeptide (TPR) repeat protein
MKCPKCQTNNPSDSKYCKECATPLPTSRDIDFSHTKTLETPIEELPRGTTFAGRYEIIEELGHGGMGKVYKVFDKEINAKVALKLIKPEVAADKNTIERFRNELRIARDISHKNVCRMYDLGREAENYFITMEYVPGEDLKSFIRRARRLDIGTAISIARQVCEGLAEAHRLGVAHRDLKPGNIMIDRDGNAKIMDFGIARSLKAKGITDIGMMIGTPEYMSPEQVEGKDVDQRSDLYSLGIILYEMLTGRVPFEGDTPFSVALKQKSEIPRDPRDLNTQIPDPLSEAIQKCLAKNRDSRYQTPEELLEDLDLIEKELPTTEKAVLKRKAKTIQKISVGKKKILQYAVTPILLFLLIFIAIYFLTIGRRTTRSVAVLPFIFIGGDSDDQAFCDGLAVTISDKLLQLEYSQRSIWAIPVSEVRREEIKGPANVKPDLGVDLVITGNMRRSGNMIQLTVNLVDTRTLLQLGSPLIFADPITNLRTWQDDIIAKTVQLMGVKARPKMNLTWAAGWTSLPNAYESHLKGLGYLQQPDQAESVDKAIQWLKRAVEQDSHYALAQTGLANAYWSKYRLTKDPASLEEAQACCRLAIQMNDQLVPVHMTLGIINRETGQYEKAIQEFRRVLQIEPDSYLAYLGLGETYKRLERLKEAEAAFKNAMRLRPDCFIAYAYLGYFYYVYGRSAKAEKMFLKVTKLTPGSIWAYNSLGGIYATRGRYESAEAMFKKSIAIQPSGIACSNLGTIYFFQRRYGDSAAIFEEAVKLEEKNSMICGNLADAYRCIPEYSAKAGETYERALHLAEEELAKNPNDPQIIAQLARYHILLGDQAKGLDEIAQALKMAPSDIWVLLKNIQVYELAKQRDRALESLHKYIDQGGSKEAVLSDPDLAGLMKDPQVQQLAQKWKAPR